MNIKTGYNILRGFIIALLGFVIVHSFILNPDSRTLRNDIIQGILLGFGLGFVMLPVIAKIYVKKINGWTTILGCGEPGKGVLFRAACAQIFPGPINVSKEAIYWTTEKDGSGHILNGKHRYIIHFPKGGFPPNNAFWSLTMGDAKNNFVPNSLKRYSISDRTKFSSNPDGSVDVYIQNTTPKDHESNWLPAPKGSFILWLRVYEPDQSVLDGKYKIPPVMEVKP